MSITITYQSATLYKSTIVSIFIFLATCVLNAAVIQPGKFLNIMVKGDADLTQQVKVQEDGTIDYPLYQDTPVSGMTTGELQDILTLKLINYTDAPFVLVTIVNELPITVYVMGSIKNPGPVKVPPRASLQEVMVAAGGVDEYANLERIKIVHKNQLDEDAAFYDLKEFMHTGILSILPKVIDGDRVIFLARTKSYNIKILGAVANPGYFVPQDSTNLFDAIYMAGGPASDANLSKVRVLSSLDGRDTDAVISLQEYIDKGKLQDLPLVLPGDVIIVYRRSFTWTKSLSVVRDIVSLVTAWFIISQLLK